MWLTFAAVFAFISAVFTIAGRHVSLTQSAELAIIVLFLAGVVSRKALVQPQVSVDDVLPAGMDHLLVLSVKCPANEGLAKQAKELAANCYGDNVTISPGNYDAIRVKNPNVLACLTADNGRLLGYFDILPLKDSFAEVFLAGKVAEDQLTHEDVCSPSEAASAKFLFISGLAVLEPESFAGRRNASILIWALLGYLRKFYATSQPLVFALAATEEGDDLLSRFRLNIVANAESRTDHYKLYSLKLSDDALLQRLVCLPDWNGLCVVDWKHAPTGLSKGKPALPQMHPYNLGSVT